MLTIRFFAGEYKGSSSTELSRSSSNSMTSSSWKITEEVLRQKTRRSWFFV
ncbi:hypothetical protein HanIR_Chr05g0222891 [Helianthus annuus]|nr:hypothetical protein HanIR_Chr05g0222891 [Helianthus annuus]